MRILEKATTPNGIKIHLGDLSENDNKQELFINAFPVSKNSLIGLPKGEYFCLGIYTEFDYTNDDILMDFEALKYGEKTLEDLSKHFFAEKRHEYLLGMINSFKE